RSGGGGTGPAPRPHASGTAAALPRRNRRRNACRCRGCLRALATEARPTPAPRSPVHAHRRSARTLRAFASHSGPASRIWSPRDRIDVTEGTRDETLLSLLAELPSTDKPAAHNIERALRAIRLHLGMEVAFVAEFASGRRVFRYVDSSYDGPVQVGASNPLEESYCLRVVDGRLPELMHDASAIPEAAAMAATQALPVGAHLGVPVKLGDGRLFGTFCCFSRRPDETLTPRDLELVRAVAELTAYQIDRDLEAGRERERKTARVKRVLEEDGISAVYQPIFRLGDRRIVGLECLSRFATVPHRPPDAWFSEAIEVGLGVELELAAIRKGLEALPVLPPDVYLAVNVSPAMIASGALEEALAGTPVERIVLEMTEHEVVPDYQVLSEALAPLRARGLRLAIDDVGAGYASLRHILSLRPDVVKLDVSLTRHIDSDQTRRALAAALIAFPLPTGSPTAAEGVETEDELQALLRLGVYKAQGFHLARPMPLGSARRLFSAPRPTGT